MNLEKRISSSTPRIHGLDTLRASAIILVYLTHYGFVVNHPVFDIGNIGVDLFFVLSGYLIGHQIFNDLAHKNNFSIKIFMIRRLFRTLPNYVVVLAPYIFIESFREKPLLPPMWKLLTFTANFGLKTGTAFSNVWSLCIEEQFYLALPLIAIFIYYKKSIKLSWLLITFALIGGIFLRTYIWINYTNGMAHSEDLFNYKNYYAYIYYFTFCRLDPIICGVILAMIRNFHSHTWHKITLRGNLTLVTGITSLAITCYIIMHDKYLGQNSFSATVIGFPMLGFSFGLLVLSALSPNSILHKVKIWGAERLAALSFAIYLLQKPLDHFTSTLLSSHNIINKDSPLMFLCTASIAILGGWLLYSLIETPFMKLRDAFYKKPTYK